MDLADLRKELPDSLHIEQQERVLVVRLSRPAKRNALNDPTLEAIGWLFSSLPADAGAAVLHGEGDHFSAGLDLSELAERDAVEGLMHSRMWHRALDAVQYGTVPVVAVLHGAVIGGGLELAAAAHLRIAEQSAYYALPEGERGIFLGGGGSVRLPRLIGVHRVMDMMMTGRVIRAAEGTALGFSQYVVEDGQGVAKALQLARTIAGNARMTNYALMHVLPRIGDAAHDQGLMMESLVTAIAQSAPEAKSRIRAFLDKRAGKVGKE
jgi:(methylthio)acryloyl-CoA hydratase